MEKLWTKDEVARYLGVGEPDVEALVQHGALTAYKLGGQFVRFRPEQVQGLKGRIQPGPAAPRRRRGQRPWQHVRDFIYFYDFYLVSATCLAVLVVYLIAS